MKTYNELEVKVTRFATSDIITASGENTGDNTGSRNCNPYSAFDYMFKPGCKEEIRNYWGDQFESWLDKNGIEHQ